MVGAVFLRRALWWATAARMWAAAPSTMVPSPVAARSAYPLVSVPLLGAESGIGIALGDDCVVERACT